MRGFADLFDAITANVAQVLRGKNDTIDNNFTAGHYPGMGGRNIAGDGHVATFSLSSEPLP